MAFFTFNELLDLVIMTFALGYIFMAYIKRPQKYSDLLTGKVFNWDDFKFALIVTAPAVVLHELAHKFAGLAMGLTSIFHASYFGLGLGVILRVFSSPFIVFIPGYVSISGATPLQSALTAFMGPFMNLLLFSIAYLVLQRKRKMTQNQAIFWYLTKQINLFLFFFNMIPLPPFDGSKVFAGLFGLF